MQPASRSLLVICLVLAGCGDGEPPQPGAADAAPVSTAHCELAPLPANANASGLVEAGAVTAGAAEGPLDLPVGSALGAYTARASFLGDAGRVDERRWEYSGSFNPSVGIETTPMAKAVAITAGSETVILMKADLGVGYDGLTHDLAERLGPAYRGKLLLAVSHSHSAPGHFTANTGMGVGFSRFRRAAYDRLLDRLEAVARDALAARQPARVGVIVKTDFDPDDQVTRDRRVENDALAGGARKDTYLALIRVDATNGTPLAVVPVFGIHGTILDADNPLVSTDAPGAIERALAEQFDRPVVVMHLQGAGGGVSPVGHGDIACDGAEYCYRYAAAEGTGRAATSILYQAWQDAEAVLADTLPLEMVTRSVELGPRAETFGIRDGTLTYAPFDTFRECDGAVFDGDGAVISPIDEFNAPVGAALCGTVGMNAIFPEGQIPGTECLDGCAASDLRAYQSCVRLDTAARLLGAFLALDFEGTPVCASTRTTVSAIQLGELLLVTLPGEPLTLLADALRARSPVDAAHTIVVGYAQGHMGYLLTAEDWLLGGYEPSINFWGPLEGEYIAERAAEVMALAHTPARDDGAAGGTTRYVTPATSDDRDVPAVDPAPLAGMVPALVPADVYVRGRLALASAQPPEQVARLASAHFVWIGEDPLAGTPVVTLQRESAPGTALFVDVVRRSGRVVADGDLLRTWTPIPLRRAVGVHATHYWVAEWQAVTWSGIAADGAPLTDALADRAGVPLGRYRFHVVGTGYELHSGPFEVTAGALAVSASRAGNVVSATASYDAARGWRLLDTQAPSNRPVPLRTAPVHVVLKAANDVTLLEADVSTDVAGALSVDAGALAADVQRVVVTDRFGNGGSAPL